MIQIHPVSHLKKKFIHLKIWVKARKQESYIYIHLQNSVNQVLFVFIRHFLTKHHQSWGWLCGFLGHLLLFFINKKAWKVLDKYLTLCKLFSFYLVQSSLILDHISQEKTMELKRDLRKTMLPLKKMCQKAPSLACRNYNTKHALQFLSQYYGNRIKVTKIL